MYERFTDRARRVMQLANREAQRMNHEYIGTEHILLGLVADAACEAPPRVNPGCLVGWLSGSATNATASFVPDVTSTAGEILKNLKVDAAPAAIRAEVNKIVQEGRDATFGKLPPTPRAKKVIEYAMEEVRELGRNYVGTEHLLLGLLREKEGIAACVLTNLGVTVEAVREQARTSRREP